MWFVATTVVTGLMWMVCTTARGVCVYDTQIFPKPHKGANEKKIFFLEKKIKKKQKLNDSIGRKPDAGNSVPVNPYLKQMIVFGLVLR